MRPDRLQLNTSTGAFDPSSWDDETSIVAERAREKCERCLGSYRADPALVREHANIELATAQGGYGHRQLYELIQNGADQLVGQPAGRIHLLLTPRALYCANEGQPVSADGIEAILSSHISLKRGSEIGRFGLGFKSVLGVSSCPQIFSRTASLGFDAGRSQMVIRTVVPEAPRTPALRLAFPLDVPEAAADDRDLRDLMVWATTVVRLPRDVGDSSWLSEDLASFPSEFLLFSPHVGALVIEDRTTNLLREISVTGSDGSFRLSDGKDTVWKVFEVVHRPSEAARADAGELSAREELPLIWAVPLGGRNRRGSFWAFFPTEYRTSLSGILNAPWKTNEDRQNLLPGLFNNELIEASAKLVVSSLPELVDPADPASFLELLPARASDAQLWADELLTNRVYELARSVPSLPDQRGILNVPTALRLHPAEAAGPPLGIWSTCPTRPHAWVHQSVETRERRPRAERLLGPKGPAGLAMWLERLADSGPEGSAYAIRAACKLLTRSSDDLSVGWHALDWRKEAEVRMAIIVRTSIGTTVAAQAGEVFLPGHDGQQGSDLVCVDPEVLMFDGVPELLRGLGIGEMDAAGELEHFLASCMEEQPGIYSLDPASGELIRVTEAEIDWERFWNLLREVEPGRARELLTRRGKGRRDLSAMTLDGTYVPLERLLLPGRIAPGDRSRDSAVALDVDHHKKELAVIKSLGVADRPRKGAGSTDEFWYVNYDRQADREYERLLPMGHSRPQYGYVEFKKLDFIGPLSPLPFLSEVGRELFCHVLFEDADCFRPWVRAHSTRRDAYPIVSMPSPVEWMVRRAGRLSTSLGPRSVADAVGREFAMWARVLPVIETPAPIDGWLPVARSPENLSIEVWQRALALSAQLDDDVFLGRFYGYAADYAPAPRTVRCRSGPVRVNAPVEEVTVTSDPSHYEALLSMDTPAIIADAAGELALRSRWGLRGADGVVRTEVAPTPVAADVLLVDEFPALGWRLPSDRQDVVLVRCSAVRLQTVTPAGTRARVVDGASDGKRMYWTVGRGDVALLRWIGKELGIALDDDIVAGILEHRDDEDRRKRLEAIGQVDGLPDKLALIVGPDVLRSRLPAGLVESVEESVGPVDQQRLAELVLTVHGIETLHLFRDELEGRGFSPPVRWAGSQPARAFVRALGFPREFAGFEETRRSAQLDVEGPPELPGLHTFQSQITRQIRLLLCGEGKGTRAMLSLPTGAGKTRVAVQALVEAVRDDGLLCPILWVAQTDELCEQAVQTWSEVWRALGPRRRLHVSRLWDVNSAEPVDGIQVVVATISKLGHVIQDPSYDWLSEPSCIVIDEAHGAVSMQFNRLLDWVDLSRNRQGRPLIGLTATPFRGNSVEGTDQLAARFGRYRLDEGAFEGDPFPVLQDMGVLARVRHQVLGGSQIELTDDELEQLRTTHLLPASVGERLGGDMVRNATLVKSIKDLPQNWTVLLFATSVAHAQTVAALLSIEGISSASISAETPRAARRHYIDEFRSGGLRVLTNYGVLTQGFDAPAVRAVYVGRPTFSPNLYQQMVGRGLRGPLNGGKEECLIVDVADNIEQYHGDLAFKGFAYLWSQDPAVL